MNLLKTLVLTVLISTVFYSACFASPQDATDFSNDVTENMLLAINENQFPTASQFFDDKMKKQLNKKTFLSNAAKITDFFGPYITKELLRTESQEPYTILIYKAKFAKDDNVTIKTVLVNDADKFLISGFWVLKN